MVTLSIVALTDRQASDIEVNWPYTPPVPAVPSGLGAVAEAELEPTSAAGASDEAAGVF
ncbi:hypothetical protein GCM10010052_32500 [Paenarthrobacter histidinolovorans]|nr:hypothetical protein GCM10010052_32500 [Paenarthrobacter histidinolovorans]